MTPQCPNQSGALSMMISETAYRMVVSIDRVIRLIGKMIGKRS